MFKIGVVSQKGGVGKSTVAREITRTFTNYGWNAKLADLDAGQTTSVEWNRRRLQFGVEPVLSVEGYPSVKLAALVRGFNLIVFDGKPSSNAETLAIAKASDLIIIPSGSTVDDLVPQVRLAQELRREKVPVERLLFVLNNVSETNSSDVQLANDMIKGAGFSVVSRAIPKRPIFATAQNGGRSLSEITHQGLRETVTAAMEEVALKLKALNEGVAA